MAPAQCENLSVVVSSREGSNKGQQAGKEGGMKIDRETCALKTKCKKKTCVEDCSGWADAHIRKKSDTRLLAVKLTEAELLKTGEDLSNEIEKAALIELELKTMKEQYKAKTAEAEGRIASLSSLVRAKAEMRDVSVTVISDYTKVKVRVETAAKPPVLVEERDMTPSETQQHLAFGQEWDKAQEKKRKEAEKAKKEKEADKKKTTKK